MENRYKLVSKSNGRYYHFATVKIDLDKKELIYIAEYSFSKKEFVRYTDYEKGLVQTRKIIDHVSFHKDGTAHIVSKNLKGKKERMDPKKGPSSPFSIAPENYAPLILHSVVYEKDFSIVSSVDEADEETLVFKVENQNDFSVVLFSVGINVNWKLLLRKFGNAFNENDSKFLAEPFLAHKEDDLQRIQKGVFIDVGLLFALMPKVVPIPKILVEDEQKRGVQIKSYYDFRVFPSENGIKELK